MDAVDFMFANNKQDEKHHLNNLGKYEIDTSEQHALIFLCILLYQRKSFYMPYFGMI